MLRVKQLTQPIVVLGFYVIVRFGLDFLWRQVSPYWGFAFELAFFGLVFSLFGRRAHTFSFKCVKPLMDIVLPLGLGAGVMKLAGQIGAPVPFDFTSIELIIQLLVVAPILEELVFRFALWYPVTEMFGRGWRTVFSTSLLFSAGHFLAIYHVPEAFHKFVLYQSLYVILLGVLCGYRRWKTGSVTVSIVVHGGFNFGFFVAAVWL